MRPFWCFGGEKSLNYCKKSVPVSVQEWIPFQSVNYGKVVLKDGTYVKILEVIPINFELKSDFEKEAILESYRRLLKSCNFDIQIFIQSQVTDITKHIYKIKRLQQGSNLNEMAEDYINFIENITYNKRNISKKFYIVIKGSNNIEEHIFKIKEGLNACGNSVEECMDDVIISIMKNCFNKRLRGLERIKV